MCCTAAARRCNFYLKYSRNRRNPILNWSLRQQFRGRERLAENLAVEKDCRRDVIGDLGEPSSADHSIQTQPSQFRQHNRKKKNLQTDQQRSEYRT